MNTKQHILNPVERTFCASGLLGRPGQRHVDRDYLGQSTWLDSGTAAGMLGFHGLNAVIPGVATSA